MSSATLPPWLSPWSTGLVYGDRVYKVNERLRPPLERSRHRPRLTIYTYGHGNNAPILSWSEDGSGAGAGAGPGAASGGVEGAMAEGGGGGGVGGGAGGGAASEAPPAVRWERVPLNHEPWHVDVPVPIEPRPHDRPQRYDVTGHSDMEWELPRGRAGAGGAGAGAGGAGAAEALHAWAGVLRGWAAGATLLALLFILVRVGERFLDRKIHLLRRANASTISRLRGSHPPPAQLPNDDECSVELPPPYSACLVPKADEPHAEPPPPYSDCAQLVNKHGPVILFSRETQRRLARSPGAADRPDSPARAAPARSAPGRPPLSATDAASQARLARDLDFLLRDLGISFNDLPPPPLSVLRMHDEYTRLQQQSDPSRSPSPLPVPDLDAMNSPPTELEEVALNNPIDAVAPNDAVLESQDDTPNEADKGPDPEVAPTCTGADPLGIHDVATDESVVV